MHEPVELLVIARKEQTVSRLCSALQKHGITVDVASDVVQARAIFLQRGGHHLLVIGPDTGNGMARQIVDYLRGVDPQLRVVVFGTENFRDARPTELSRIPAFHPSSRAGIGAVLKVIQGLGANA